MAKKIPVVIEENWDTYFSPTDEGMIYVTFYAGAGELPQDDYPFCARVLLPIKQPAGLLARDVLGENVVECWLVCGQGLYFIGHSSSFIPAVIILGRKCR